VSDSVYRLASDYVTIKKYFQVRLKGIQKPVSLHVVEEFRDKAS